MGLISAPEWLGIVILIMCVTGAALAFERQAVKIAARAARVPVSSGSERLPIDKLVEKLSNGTDGLSGITISAHRSEPVAFAFGRERILYVDPYNGRVLGQAQKVFVISSLRWSDGIERSGPSFGAAAPGRAIADAANFLFLFLVVSGFYLWLPRVWSSQRVRSITLFRRNLSVGGCVHH